MASEHAVSGALDGLRVVDLTAPEGHLCGRLLADLGAEVIKVEPPEGDPARHAGPFKGDRPDPEASLAFIDLNTNKKSVTLDLGTAEGREALRRLIATADAIVETHPPSVLEGCGLVDDTSHSENPGLVIASISGFGRSGPHAHFKAPSIVCAAMGGVMYLCGAPDRPPLAEPGDQPYHLASAFAAYGILLALRQRERTERGQRVEVACQTVQAAQQHVVVNYSANATILRRAGSRSPVGGGMPYGIYPAQDGFCHLVVIAPAHWRNLVEWMGSPELLAEPMWENRHLRAANADLIEPLVLEFTQTLPKAELFAQGQRAHITVAPINRPDEFTRDPHALARGVFVDTHHPALGACRMVRSPLRLSATPATIFRPAPRLGEHNAEILARLREAVSGNEKESPEGTTAPSAINPVGRGGAGLPLEGIRVLDFSQAIAGPLLTRLLAEHGAEVIKLESQAYQQRGRSRADMDPRILLQQKVTFADVNRNKRSIALNMATAEGRELARRLVPLCDVVVENFSPRVLEQWGLGYEDLRRLRSDIIMARLSGFGLTGPYRDYVGLAAVAMGITGMYYLWSYPDHAEPAGPPVWIPDYLSAAFGGVALMAALRHRERTGRGQLIDLGQVDATAAALGTTYLDYFVNGRVPQPLGNRHPRWAPHGVYRCRGADGWCAIAVRDDAEWQALGEAIGGPPWVRDERFASAEGRLAHQDELDRLIEGWTGEHTPHQVMYTLQKVGVPAGAVQDGEQLFRDPQLRARGFTVRIDDPDDGPIDYPGSIVRLSESAGRIERCRRFGEDSGYVFGTLLGLAPERIRQLGESGVLA